MIILKGDEEVELKTDLEKLLAAVLKAALTHHGGGNNRFDLPRYSFHDVVFLQHGTLQITSDGDSRDVVQLVSH